MAATGIYACKCYFSGSWDVSVLLTNSCPKPKK
jgi:hypothetical protein